MITHGQITAAIEFNLEFEKAAKAALPRWIETHNKIIQELREEIGFTGCALNCNEIPSGAERMSDFVSLHDDRDIEFEYTQWGDEQTLYMPADFIHSPETAAQAHREKLRDALIKKRDSEAERAAEADKKTREFELEKLKELMAKYPDAV